MIDGCLDWQRNRLVRPQAISATTETYFADQDVFGQWLADECEVEPGNPYKTGTNAELFGSWCAYAARAGEVPGTQKSFAGRMQDKGLERFRTEFARGWRGVRLRPATRLNPDG